MEYLSKTIGLLCVMVLLIGVLLLGCVSSSQAVKDQSPQVVFENTCSKCHSIDRPLDMTKTPAEWRETVKKMQSKPFSGISDEKAEIIINYLSEVRGK